LKATLDESTECLRTRRALPQNLGALSSMKSIAHAVMLAAVASCASYQAQPLDAQRARVGFEGRSLNDPALAAFARERLGADAEFPPQRWDLASLTLVAFHEHPDLAVARAETEVARAKSITAAQRPNPTLGLDQEYLSNPASGVDPWLFGFHLDIPIEGGSKRDVRIATAKRELELAELDVDRVAWRVRSELRAAFVEHALARRELQLVRDELALQREVLAVLQQRFEAGEVSRPDVASAEIDAARAELELVQLESRVRATRAALAGALGMPESALADVEFDFDALRTPPPTPEVARARDLALTDRLDVRRARIEYEMAELALQAAINAQYPDVHLVPGYTYDHGEHKFAFGAAFEIPLFNNHEGPIAEANASRSAAAQGFDAVQTRALTALDQARARHAGALTELGSAGALAARGRERVVAEQRAFDLGASDHLALAEARLQSALLERAQLEALGKVQQAQSALEDVMQRPLENVSELAPEPQR
jgi:outer membrane protein TolC